MAISLPVQALRGSSSHAMRYILSAVATTKANGRFAAKRPTAYKAKASPAGKILELCDLGNSANGSSGLTGHFDREFSVSVRLPVRELPELPKLIGKSALQTNAGVSRWLRAELFLPEFLSLMRRAFAVRG
jgi:hypothetical protein